MIQTVKLSKLQTWCFDNNFPKPLQKPIGVEVWEISTDNYFVVNKRDIHFLKKLRDLPIHLKQKIIQC